MATASILAVTVALFCGSIVVGAVVIARAILLVLPITL
jgi:hypothetical protein